MNYLRLTALSTFAGFVLLAGCSSDASTSLAEGAAADTANPVLPPLTAFEKRLKFARLPPSLDFASGPITELSVTDEVAHAGYPAFQPNTPTVVSHGGPTLTNPRIVTVTWDGDPNREVYERFGDEIGSTTYWHDTTSEYGVGKAVSGPQNHVHIATPMTTIADDAIDDMVRSALKDGVASGWPAFDQQTIYNIFVPANALMFGTHNGCDFGIGGYHTDSIIDPNDDHSAEFMYAVNLNCPAKWDIHTTTLIASHELVESATDPLPSAHAAYVGIDDKHLAYDMLNQFQDEVGDACEFFKSSEYVGGAPFAFGLQRNWSNKSALAGHDPCVPRSKLPYFNVTTFASSMDSIKIDLTSLGDEPHTTAGFNAAVGQVRTFDIGFYSDAPTGADWTVWAKVPPTLPITDEHNTKVPNGQAVATLDNPAGHNGHKATVSVTPMSFNSLGVIYMELHSVLQGAEEKVYPLFLASGPVPPPPAGE